MVLDKVAFYYYCESVPLDHVINGLKYCTCKYEWLCMSYFMEEITQMFYSEGE